jgi:hypothetical protein
MSSSTASSGVPGIGYLSGKAVKWLGLQILSGFATVQIYRRQTCKAGGEHARRTAHGMDKRERDINHKIEELFSYVYRFATLESIIAVD